MLEHLHPADYVLQVASFSLEVHTVESLNVERNLLTSSDNCCLRLLTEDQRL